MPPQTPSGGSNNTALLVIAGLVLLVLVGGGAFLLLSGDDDDDNDDPSQQQAGNQQEGPAGGTDPGTATPDPGGGTEAPAGGGDRQAYVDAITTNMNSDAESLPLSPADAQCTAGAMVDAWGVPTLQAAATPDEIRTTADDPAAFGLPMDRTWGTAVWNGMLGCMDPRQALLDEATADPSMSPQQQTVVTCIFSNLTDAELQEVFVGGLTGDDATLEQTMTRAATSCQ